MLIKGLSIISTYNLLFITPIEVLSNYRYNACPTTACITEGCPTTTINLLFLDSIIFRFKI